MTRTVRFVMFAVAGGAVAAMLLLGVLDLPHFGSSLHPYRDAAVPAAVAHATSNVISSVNFDLRGLDTLGEETIFLTSVIGVAALLRPAEDEDERTPPRGGRLLDMTRLFGYVFLPVTLAIGFITVAHGALTPGGGFQGGVVLGTGIHLLYVAGSYHAIEKVRPVEVLEYGESIGAAAFACFGIAGALVAASFLGNILPLGTFGELFSSGSVLYLSCAVGVEVASGVIVLLAQFLHQAIEVESDVEAANA
jgi:multicomponent Na+:H+ antiporter subunit B